MLYEVITKAIENAQSKVEGHNFEIRKHLLEYDDVMNQQREIIYRQRREALTAKDLKQVAQDMMEDVSYDLVEGFVSVITSYSIHYTKLYETSLFSC